MDKRLLVQMIKKLSEIEQQEKSIQEAELQLSIQRNMEREQERKCQSEKENCSGFCMGEYPG